KRKKEEGKGGRVGRGSKEWESDSPKECANSRLPETTGSDVQKQLPTFTLFCVGWALSLNLLSSCLCLHQATVAEKLSHSCPYCEAVFATKVRLQKHKQWNHPDRVSMELKDEQSKLQKTPIKFNTKKRPMENNPPSPVFFKVKKTHEVSMPSQNGELAHQKSDKKQHSHSQQTHQSLPVQPQFQQSQSQSTSSDAGGSESEGGSLPPPFPDEDPERMRHRRKQKTPKKFTGEQPSISGTFGLKGMTKVEEKLKAGRVKRPDGCGFSEEPQRRPTGTPSAVSDSQWQRAISERGEVVCPTCSIVTRKTIHGLKKHMEICQKGCSAHFSSLMGFQYHQKRCGGEFSDNEKPVFLCQHCGKSYRSKAGRDYHVRTEHSPSITTTMPSTNNNSTDTSRDEVREKAKQREQDNDKVAQNESQGDDFDRTPSGRVRRRSAQVAVFHLQEIAEDELAKDWGTKRRIKDDLVPDSKRLNYTRPGLPNFSPDLLESWKNQVKEKGFICCTNENCEAVYSSVSGLKAHLANCKLGKYTCLICQKEFSSESGVKYHISKSHSQNWFRAAASQVVPSSKTKVLENNRIKEVRNGATSGKKRGRKPKERPPVVVPLQTKTEASTISQNSTPAKSPSSGPTQSPARIPDPTDCATSGQNRQPMLFAARGSKPKRQSLLE
uniref:C2H2-type domain-containing protein n=1 Tax=Mola mola TaxID=94237 RepID=A0A3Q4BXH6_MOLML